MTKEMREAIVFWMSVASTILSVTVFFIVAGAEAYVRFTMNQNFSFLGGFSHSALAFLALGQVVALAYIHRPGR